jgi:diguanylate cyclase (GGDEF)-like protein
MSLTFRVTVAVVLPFLLVLLVVVFLFDRTIETERTSQEREDRLTLALVEERFGGVAADLATAGTILANSRDTARALEARDLRFLFEWSRLFHSPTISRIVFFDTTGIVLSRSDQEYSFSDNVAEMEPFSTVLDGNVFRGLVHLKDGLYLADARPVLLYGEIPVGGIVTAVAVTEELLNTIVEDTGAAVHLVLEGRHMSSDMESTPRRTLPMVFSPGDGLVPERAELVFFPSQSVEDLVGLQRQLLGIMSLLLLTTAILVVLIVRVYLRPYTDLIRELLVLARGDVPYDQVPHRFEEVFSDRNHESYIIAAAVAQFVATIDENMAALERLSTTDQLTGLYNRRHMDDVIRTECSRAERYGTPLAVLITDIDHFKTVNDTFGHQTGDTVLVEISHRMAGMIRETDTIARWGGEEFLLVCPGLDRVGAAALAEKLRIAVERAELLPQDRPDSPSPIGTASFGVAVWHPGDDPDSLIRRADSGLYTAKRQGRNRVAFADTD